MLGVSVIAFVDMDAQPTLLMESALWSFLADALGNDQALEHGIPKLGAEYLVFGDAHAPGGAPVDALGVGVRFGPLEKRLVVRGDRRWDGRTAGAPQPFQRMPLDWTRAYGGPTFASNPMGRGHAGKGDLAEMLPNVEYPGREIVQRGDDGVPAGFGPIDIAWPQRASRSGTYDERWLKTLYPGFPMDIDWRHFNIAPDDQWLERPAAADEQYTLAHLHPQKPRIDGRLPGVVARAFVRRKDRLELEELSLELRTVAFFPGQERIVMVYQGALEVVDEQAADISHLLVAADAMGHSRPAGHFADVLARRLDKEEGAYHVFNDAELTPGGMRLGAFAAEAEIDPDPALERALKRGAAEIEAARERVASHGLDPDKHAPAAPQGHVEAAVPPERLADHVRDRLAEVQAEGQRQWRWAQEQDRSIAEVMLKAGQDFGLILKERGDGHSEPPSFSAKAQIGEFRELSRRMHAMGEPVEEIDAYLADPRFHRRHAYAEEQMQGAYRLTAQHQPAPQALSTDAQSAVRRSLMGDLAVGISVVGRRLLGADLRGVDLRGADLSHAQLTGADLRGTDLRDCVLRGAVMAHAQLDGAVLADADLREANLGGASLRSANLRGARLGDAILARADLDSACFAGAVLDGADLADAQLNQVDFSGAAMSDMLFQGVDFAGARLIGATASKCLFIDCLLDDVDLSGADFSGSAWMNGRAPGAIFRGTRMTSCVFVAPSQFDGAVFDGADLSGACLREASLVNARFEGTVLRGADLSGARLSSAWLYEADARQARFVAADLSNAVLANLNGMNAIFERADLRGADLRQANLFQADLARVKIDTATRWDGRLATRARVYPRLKLEEMGA